MGASRTKDLEYRLASPCSQPWEGMAGDDRARWCGQCKRHVYNVESLSRAELERVIVDQGGAPCVRLFRRADGTVLTRDCPVGLRRRLARRVVAALALVGLGALLAWAGFRPRPPPFIGTMF